jgi:hypothetical protein
MTFPPAKRGGTCRKAAGPAPDPKYRRNVWVTTDGGARLVQASGDCLSRKLVFRVPDYRLFHLQADGDATGVEDFFATSDETALNYAVTRTGLREGELWSWSERRFVALITKNGAGAQ